MRAVDVIEEAQLLIGDPKIDFHDQKRMLFALNRATNRISTRSRSIHKQWHRPVVAGQYQYALPPGTLFIRKVKYKLGEWYDLSRGHFSLVEAEASYSGGGPPRSFSLWQNTVVEKYVGTVYAVDNDASRARGLIRQLTVPVEVDDNNLRVGDIVYNLSDSNAQGTITQLFTDTVPEFPGSVYKFAYTALVGGEADRFDVNDEIRITSPHTKGHSIIVSPSPVRTDEGGDESIAAFVARKHREITATEIANENDFMELDDEFNDTLMYEILHWARVQRTGLDTTARMYRQLSNDEYMQAIPKVENRIAQTLNSWERRYGGYSDYRDVSVKGAYGSYNNYRVV